MIISRKAKEAVKTALAITIAYGIALSMNWDKPLWAGFAVVFVSLATVGQSFNKAAMRMFGTLAASVAAFTIIALFPQERWLFMLFLSMYIGFCTYMMGGAKQQYFWNVCGFVCLIICMDAGPNSVNAFEIAVLRTQETGLGILVYSLVAILLWPTSSFNDFTAAASSLASSHHQLYLSYFSLMKGEGDQQEAQTLKAQVLQGQTRLDQLLDAAETDTYEVWELRRQWRLYQGYAGKLTETLECWRESFAEIEALDMHCLLPNLDTFNDELQSRFTQIERMLANQEPDQQPASMDLDLDRDKLQALSDFQRAALIVTRARLQDLERLSRFQFVIISDIKGYKNEISLPETIPAPRVGFMLDMDRLIAGGRVILTLWLAYLAVIYIDSLPGGSGVVTMAGPMAMMLATTPQLSVTLLFKPAAASTLFASLLYIFVMPQLSSFLGLGPLIFAVTFAICYLFAAPKQVLGRALGMAMFISIASISNHQSYSFMVVANTALMFPVVFLILAITAYFPFSARPEKAFLRLLGRYFRSCEYLISLMSSDNQSSLSRLSILRKDFHLHEISTLPTKLGAWTSFMDTKILPGTSAPQVQALVSSLQGLSPRIQELIEERNTQQAQLLVQELLIDLQSWCLKVQKTFHRLAVEPGSGTEETFRAGLAHIMAHMETRIKETLDKAEEGQLSSQDGENFYRLLGAFRGVSEAIINYTRSAGAIDWSQWHEERF